MFLYYVYLCMFMFIFMFMFMFIYVSLLCLFMYVYVYSKYERIFSYLQIRSNLPKRNVMKNFLRRSNNNLQARGYF